MAATIGYCQKRQHCKQVVGRWGARTF